MRYRVIYPNFSEKTRLILFRLIQRPPFSKNWLLKYKLSFESCFKYSEHIRKTAPPEIKIYWIQIQHIEWFWTISAKDPSTTKKSLIIFCLHCIIQICKCIATVIDNFYINWSYQNRLKSWRVIYLCMIDSGFGYSALISMFYIITVFETGVLWVSLLVLLDDFGVL